MVPEDCSDRVVRIRILTNCLAIGNTTTAQPFLGGRSTWRIIIQPSTCRRSVSTRSTLLTTRGGDARAKPGEH